jgi:hypothetical protein
VDALTRYAGIDERHARILDEIAPSLTTRWARRTPWIDRLDGQM